mgnify:CR=1 FL=1
MTDPNKPRPLWLIALLCVVVGVSIIPFIVTDLTQPQTQYLAGVMVLSAGVLAFWGTHLTRVATEKDNLRAHQREREGDLHERFTAAVTQLNDSKGGIRQAGAYALAALANDWSRHGEEARNPVLGYAERQVCIDILCAYLRDPLRVSESGHEEVRATIVELIRSFTLLGERKRPSWTGHDFFLSGAQLEGTSWKHANLSGAKFTDANLSLTSFIRADLSGVRLMGANLTGANLTGARLVRADLSAANLKEAILTATDLSEVTWTSETVWPTGFTPPPDGHRNP